LSLETKTEVVIIEKWSNFFNIISKYDRKRLGLIFRGQRDPSWLLQSSFERWVAKIGPELESGQYNSQDGFSQGHYEKYRDAWLKKFIDALSSLGGQNSIINGSVVEQWAFARHHGLLTPLLDWTDSPYIAAYFAFTDWMSHKNPGLFSHCLQGKDTRVTPFLDLNESTRDEKVSIWAFANSGDCKHLKIIKNLLIYSERQLVQRGLFTWLESPKNLD
jgi:hypothetical protein